MPEGYVSTTEAARRVGSSPEHLRSAIRRGALPAVRAVSPRNGHPCWLVRPEDAAAWAARRPGQGRGGGGASHAGQGWPSAERNRAKTHCPAGHPYAGDNLRQRPDGRRECRACQDAHRRRSAERSREARRAA